jgi:hypothetical protein
MDRGAAMGAIFISYTGRDPEGDAWADRLVGWFQEWNYGYFRDKDHSHGVKAGGLATCPLNRDNPKGFCGSRRRATSSHRKCRTRLP